jgi:hypothetical protein
LKLSHTLRLPVGKGMALIQVLLIDESLARAHQGQVHVFPAPDHLRNRAAIPIGGLRPQAHI